MSSSPALVPFDPAGVPSPSYVVDTGLLVQNLEILARVRDEAGCRILLALKGFAMWSLFPLIRPYLAGVSASSLDEARLGAEEFGGQVHVYAPAFRDDEFPELVSYADHLIFNSFSQWHHFRPQLARLGTSVSCGIRINPQYSEVPVPLYDPCVAGSRLGVTASQFDETALAGIEGLHFHSHCGQNSDVLVRTLTQVEARFGHLLGRMAWLNLGGGHHITRPDYDLFALIALLRRLRQQYGVEIFLEPGEAVALNTGFLVATVLDIVHNDMAVAILDTSAAAHMPDVLEMPYRPEVVGAGLPGQHAHTFRLAGLTCLAGDVIGDYSFPAPLTPGQRLVFCDMAHYSMVKNNTFNGVRLPAIAIHDAATGTLRVVRRFGYEDYRDRLS
ncbi:MAG: carboxynorspermidine decarboxylase [Thermodesulfobacteriota bacterium]